MRWSVPLAVAVAAAVVLSGCSSQTEEPAPEVGIAATDLTAGNLTQTVFPLRFAGGTREGDLVLSETFAATDTCFFLMPQCPATHERTYDLTPLVPASVPVEIAIVVEVAGDIDVDFDLVDAQFIRIDSDDDGDGTRIDATLVRAEAGTIELVIQFQFPSPEAAQAATLTGSVHTVTRAEVVPAFLPVAVELGPGDTVNATGDGLEQFVAFPPAGEPLRALTFPFSLTVPADGAKGTYYLLGAADEALKLTGPNRTLSARLLDFVQTPPVDVAPNQATTFTMDVAGVPLHAGVAFQSNDLADTDLFLHGLTLMGNHKVELVSPDRVDVLGGGAMANCSPMCEVAFLGSMDDLAYSSGFLDEHLKAGTYEATVTMETSNDVQAYAFALSIRQG